MIELETAIVDVTVYPDRARVIRRGKIALEPGAHSIQVSGLPLSMNPDSARMTGRGTARVRLLGLQLQTVFFSETPVEQVRALEAQVETLQDEIAGLDSSLELRRSSRQRLDALAGHTQEFATALAAGEMSVAAQLDIFAGLQERAASLDSEMQAIQVEKRAADRRLGQLQSQLDQVRSARSPQRYQALVDLETLEGGSLDLELSYVVSEAGWKPLYDLRLVEEEEKAFLEVGYLAQVSQRTGEDWMGVSLTLSTARPALAAALPELKPWYIQPAPPRAVPPPPRPAVRTAAALPSKEQPLQAAPVPVVEVEQAQAAVDSAGASITYRTAAQADIPSDGSPYKATIARYELAPRLDYVAAPKLVEAVYRRALVRNESDFLLLPGKANLFAGQEFIGATALELTAPQGEVELYLGVDDRIKVERELKRREVDKSLVGGKRRVHYGYEVRLENLLSVEARLTVHDQLPVGRHEEIKVRLGAVEPKPAERGELNLLDWELAMQPGEKRSLRFDFTVEYPQEMQVLGLP